MSRGPCAFTEEVCVTPAELELLDDPRLTFLERAAEMLAHVDMGRIELDEAFAQLFEEIEDGFEALVESLVAVRQPEPRAPRPTPATTIEAILFCVRKRGIAALKEPENQRRLHSCDAAAHQTINNRIARLFETEEAAA
jgi:hypothetical protein